MGTTQDAVGQALAAGDHVAHVRRTGSRIRIERRIIDTILDGGMVQLVGRSKHRSPPCNPDNLIKVRAP